MLHPHVTRLDNGIRLLVVQDPLIPIMAVHMGFARGTTLIPANQAGLGSLFAAVLTKGTSRHGSQEIAQLLGDWGARLSVETGPDTTEILAKCVEEDFAALLELLAAMIQTPTFPPQEVEREQLLLLQAIRSRQEQILGSLYEKVCAHLYGDHPYAQPPLGTVETVQALSREDLIWCHRQICQPQDMVITVVGSLAGEQVVEVVERHFGSWDPEPRVQPSLPAIMPVAPGRLLVPQDSQQTTIMLAYLGCGAGSVDFTPLSLLMHYLGNGLSSRLFVELREKQGLAYEVSAFLALRRHPAPFVVYLATAADNTQRALAGLEQEMALLCQEPIPAATWLRVQRQVVGQYMLSQQTHMQIAQRLGSYELLGLGHQFAQRYPQQIQQTTPQLAWEVAQKYLHNPTLALAGSPPTLAIVAVD
ncbi:MAG: pitrilysin family protein [Thermostichales cyanobacterium BF3_bins_165]